MLHDRKKLAKITEELTMFFFSIGAKKISSVTELSGQMATITFTSDYPHTSKHKLESMHRLLNSEKADGMEEVYWELVGAGEPGEASQLLLVGLMVDSADVDILDNCVKIKLYKKLPS